MIILQLTKLIIWCTSVPFCRYYHFGQVFIFISHISLLFSRHISLYIVA